MKMKTLKFIFNKICNTFKNEAETADDEEIEEDYVVKCMGSFGLYQAVVCTIAGLSRSSAMWNILSVIFIAPKIDFICKEFESNIVTMKVKNLTCYEECVKYEYHQEVFKSTLISKFDLICERAWLADFAQTVLMLGVFLGSWLFGWVSDRRGRRVALRLANFLNIIFMFSAMFSVNYWIFITTRFFVGVTTGGIFVISTVYVLEVVGSNHRESAVCWVLIPDGFAEAMMAVFAYYSSTWDIFLMEYCAVSVFIFILVLCLPDTLRWNVAHGKVKRAVEVATRATIWNNQDTSHIEDSIKEYMDKVKVPEDRLNTHHMYLFDEKDIRKTFCLFLIYTQVGIGFFGIKEFIASLVPNVYSCVIILGLIQVPAALFSITLIKIYGRRSILMVVSFINGLSMLVLTFLPKGNWITIFVAFVSLSSIIIAFSVSYIFVAELFPTPLRNMALGVHDSGSKLGAIVTPFLMYLYPVWAPSLVLAILPLISLGLCLLLPETKGRHLKDTIN